MADKPAPASAPTPGAFPAARADARPQPKKVGRPTKLNDEMQEKFCSYIAAGNYFETAAALCGISQVQAREWAKQGVRDREKGVKSAAARFSEALDEAHAKGEARLVIAIGKSAERDWRAAAFMLERKYPNRWGEVKQEKATVTQVNVTPEAAASMFDGRSEEDLRYFVANGHWPEEAAQ